MKRGADKHYPLMKTKDIMAMRLFVYNLSFPNSHLYLWVTNNFLEDGLKVMGSWGFRYVTNLVWVKDKFGLGQYFRGKHELCLFGVKGKLPYKVLDGKRQQAPTVIVAPRSAHSVKPVELYDIIEKVSYPPFVELFARSKREGWFSWGNEVD